jgi:two-component system response regulator GlrR
MGLEDEIDVSELAADEPVATELIGRAGAGAVVARFRVVCIDGPGKGKAAVATSDRLSIGSHPSNELIIDDPAVSRFHCEIAHDVGSTWLVDLDSSNGTELDGVALGRGRLRGGSLFKLGRSVCRFEIDTESVQLPVSDRAEFGELLGNSVAMRSCFALLERVANSDTTVLLEGETGTGKEVAAAAIHAESGRKAKPFLVVDCGALPANLLESELFGHEKGAFTGADARRSGVFEDADGGTVFLDEIGELPEELQPKLLRVIEQRQVRALGSSHHRKVNVRIVAATNRDLRAQVNDGGFRADLYFRLAVFKIRLPALRRRPEDIPVLAAHFLDQFGATDAMREQLLAPESLTRMQRAAWVGNVRELRNYLERCAVMQLPLPTGEQNDRPTLHTDASLPYSQAKRLLLDDFERSYLQDLLKRHGGNVSKAARAAGMDRVYVYKLMQRHGIKPVRS